MPQTDRAPGLNGSCIHDDPCHTPSRPPGVYGMFLNRPWASVPCLGSRLYIELALNELGTRPGWNHALFTLGLFTLQVALFTSSRAPGHAPVFERRVKARPALAGHAVPAGCYASSGVISQHRIMLVAALGPGACAAISIYSESNTRMRACTACGAVSTRSSVPTYAKLQSAKTRSMERVARDASHARTVPRSKPCVQNAPEIKPRSYSRHAAFLIADMQERRRIWHTASTSTSEPGVQK
ncbi:hypothetical protein JB92DRAFT_2837437 [Gautieria morchelliformis]|nr:hypothetical protein JB92DRAFT_2837437 [Gautieria morchelliformis]